MKERIQKVLAAAGVASRRAIEEMVLHGRVSVNGKVLTELPILIDPAKDKVFVDDERVKIAEKDTGPRVYLLMNKPKGVHSTNVSQGEQTRAIDLLPPDFRHRVYPVGRLDADSKGLLLLTNDGELTNQLTHPRYGVAKTYRATVDGRMSPEAVDRLQSGIWLADRGKGGFKTGRSRIHVVKRLRDKSVLEITIREGRNRQVRRMLAQAGHKVRDLTRVKMGPLTLHNLPVGSVRTLTARELKELRRMPERVPETKKVTSK
jgi:23S rRNA pseudouridine2605 synthase